MIKKSSKVIYISSGAFWSWIAAVSRREYYSQKHHHHHHLEYILGTSSFSFYRLSRWILYLRLAIMKSFVEGSFYLKSSHFLFMATIRKIFFHTQIHYFKHIKLMEMFSRPEKLFFLSINLNYNAWIKQRKR